MPSAKKLHRCAILDDYQNVALGLADWASLEGEVELTVFNGPLGGPDEIARALQGFDMVVLMRERTAFPRAPDRGAARSQAPDLHRNAHLDARRRGRP